MLESAGENVELQKIHSASSTVVNAVEQNSFCVYSSIPTELLNAQAIQYLKIC